MKTLYRLLTLLLLFNPMTTKAQKIWNVAENSTTEIKAGVKNTYVIQEGFNTGNWSQSGFLNSRNKYVVNNIDESCLYYFQETGETYKHFNKEYKIYVLKNVENGMYLSDGEDLYVRSTNKAFKFTARLAVEREAAANWDNWAIYSNGVVRPTCTGAEAAHAWVFCSAKKERKYLSFVGNPAFLDYYDTSNWLVKEAKEKRKDAHDKLSDVFNKYFTDANVVVSSEYFPVGTAPGCISQELYNELEAVYKEAEAACKNPDTTPKECDRIRENIIKIFTRYAKESIPLTDGYYFFKNKKNGQVVFSESPNAAQPYAKSIKIDLGKSDIWNADLAPFIWKVTPTDIKDHFYVQNLDTKLYFGQDRGVTLAYPLLKQNGKKILINHIKGNSFTFIPEGSKNKVCATTNNSYCRTYATHEAENWEIVNICPDSLEKLQSIIADNNSSTKIRTLVVEADGLIKRLEFMHGITFDGNYMKEDSGLVSKFECSNAIETIEGTPAGLFDGKLDTYFHTSWNRGPQPKNDWHWIQVDLGKEVDSLFIKMSQRHNRDDNSPSKYILFGTNNFEESSSDSVWRDTLAMDTVIYDYDTPYPAGARGSSTYIGKVVLKHPAQHIRFAVPYTFSNRIKGFGPCWNLAEMRFYDASKKSCDPRFTQVPLKTRNALNKAIAEARNALKNNNMLLASYENLKKTLEDFKAALPDETYLLESLKTAREMESSARESESYRAGFYKIGAKKSLKSSIEVIDQAINKNVSDSTCLTKEALNKLELELTAALKLFNTMLYKPEVGKIYHIVNSMYSSDLRNNESDQFNACLIAKDVDIKSKAQWGYKEYKGVSERFNTLWLLEKTEKGYAFKNLATGYYLANPYEGLNETEKRNLKVDKIGFSSTPQTFTLESSIEPGSFKIALTDGKFMAYGSNGEVIENTDSNNPLCQFMLNTVTSENGFSRTCVHNVTAGEIQILSFPIDLGYTSTETTSALKVAGVKDNAIQLIRYEEDEIIEAGTPFIVIPANENKELGTKAENLIYYELTNDKLEDYINVNYVRQPIVQNGLVSTPTTIKMEAGLGYLTRNEVWIANGDEVVNAGSGFFNNSIPDTDIDGEYTIPVETGFIGENTGTIKIDITENIPVDVYSISGLLIRHKAKAGEATKVLPKGIYIVGDKKVIVK